MRVLGAISKLFLQHVVALVAIVCCIILISFLPTAFLVQKASPSTTPNYGDQLSPVELDKEWRLLDRSKVYFTFRVDGDEVNTRFDNVQGTWDFNLLHPEQMQGQVNVQTAQLHSGNYLRDLALKSSGALNSKQFPEATFQLKRVDSWSDQWQDQAIQRFYLIGVLTIRGVSHDVTFACQGKREKGNLLVNGSTDVSLHDYKIQNRQNLFFKVDDKVKISLELVFGSPEQEEVLAKVTAQTQAQAPNQAGANVTDFAKPDETLPTYKATLDVDTKNKRVKGSVILHTRNQTGQKQDKLYFHIYPNQFRDPAQISSPQWQGMLGANGWQRLGGIDIQHVQVDGSNAEYGVNNTILSVPLTGGWQPGQDVTVKIDFDLTVPQENGRLSFDEHEIWLGNWLPIQAVYDQHGWNLDPYYGMGDPFYSETANYELNVSLPEKWKLASSGVDRPVRMEGGKRIFNITAHEVRDLALVLMDDSFTVASEQVGDVKVNTWYSIYDNKPAVQRIQDAATKSLAYFSQHFGQYPYKEYDVVRTGGFFGGMEYPGLVFITQSYFQNDDPHSVLPVVHETGHQWWYGVVGNDEVKEPWLDEALTDYSTLRFLLQAYPAIGQESLAKKTAALAKIAQMEAKGEQIGSSVDKFLSWPDYSAVVYWKGSLMFYRLEQAVGQKRMDAALQTYFQTYQYQVAHAELLRKTFADVIGPNTSQYFDSWLHGGSAPYGAK